MKDPLLDLLYRSFDTELSDEEQRRLDAALGASPELRHEKKQLAQIRELFATEGGSSFKPFFAARVLNRLRTQQERRGDFLDSLRWSFRLVGAVAALVLVILLANNAISGGGFSPGTLLSLPQPTLQEALEINYLPAEDL